VTAIETPVSVAPDESSAWDAFVEASDPGSYLQLAGWARVKAVNGWSSHRLVTRSGPWTGTSPEAAAPTMGAQILVRRPRPLPWGFAYAPRGPVASGWSGAELGAFTERVRTGLADAAGRVSHLRIDPEVEVDGPLDPDGALRRALAGAGWRQAIASSGPRANTEAIIDALGLHGAFAAIVAAEDVAHGKPHPEVFLTAAARLGVAPARCVVVEDAPPGIEAGQRAGMPTIGVLSTHPALAADRVVAALTDLEADAFERMLNSAE
jgi:beta-phosphoglucomutase-like phosphatase (HAD superfamily)